MLEQITALEICVRVDNGVKVRLVPRPVLLDLLNLAFVRPFKNPITGNMIPGSVNILPNPS